MAELSIETFAICPDQVDFAATVGNYQVTCNQHNPGPYGINWHCTCKGFQFRKACKHIEHAKTLQCQYDQFHNGGPPIDGQCPCCHKRVQYVGHGV